MLKRSSLSDELSPPAQLFCRDNHDLDAPSFEEASNEEQSSIQELIEKWYPQLDCKRSSVLMIGGANINSSNFKIGSYYLKLHRQVREAGLERFRKVCELAQALSENNARIGGCIRNRAGGLTSFDQQAGMFGNVAFAVQPFIDGTYFGGRVEELTEALQGIELLHQQLIKIQPAWSAPDRYTSFDPRRALQIVSHSDLGTTGSHAFDNKVLNARDVLAACATEVQETVQGIQQNAARTPWQHLDLHPHNLLFKGGSLISILDLDSLYQAPEGLGVSFAAFKLGRKLIARSGQGELVAVRKIVANYTGGIAAGRLVRLELLRRLTIILESHYLNGNSAWDGDFDKHINGIFESQLIFD